MLHSGLMRHNVIRPSEVEDDAVTPRLFVPGFKHHLCMVVVGKHFAYCGSVVEIATKPPLKKNIK